MCAMEDFDYIPLRYLNEYTYCPRLGYIELVNGEFEDNEYTVDGSIKHRVVEREKGIDGACAGMGRMTSVLLSSDDLGIIGKIDLLESESNEVAPVEYKRGRIPRVQGKVYEPEKIQLCAQGLLLQENGYSTSRGYVYYADSHKRVEVPFTEQLIAKTLSKIREFRKVASRDEPPPPLANSSKCPGCSLNKICLPDETLFLSKGDTGSEKAGKKVRRLIPARDDALPLYVIRQGTTVGKSGERLILRSKSETLEEYRLNDLSHLCLFGNVQVTTQALREMLYRDIPITYFSRSGWFYGITHAHSSKNVILRMCQYSLMSDNERSLGFCKKIVNGKIRNCRTLIRRNAGKNASQVVGALSRLASRALRCDDVEELLGIEGLAAHLYFQAFSSLLHGRKGKPLHFDFKSRLKRPSPDPVNSMLSYGYSLLLKDCMIALIAVGFDPYFGCFHQPKYGKPALALDLMEEFRPLIVDSTVMTLVNNGEVDEGGFVSRMGKIFMKKNTKTTLIEGYERRMDTVIRHPLFGYSISYRRVVEVQARLLARYITGEVEEYIPFCTR